jgi:hypothetical protein
MTIHYKGVYIIPKGFNLKIKVNFDFLLTKNDYFVKCFSQ